MITPPSTVALFVLALSGLTLSACTSKSADTGDTGVETRTTEDTTSNTDDTGTVDDSEDVIRSIQPSTLPQGPEPCREPELFRVYYVHDGDTFYVDPESGGESETIRLISIDTPELAYDDDPEECYGNEAGQYLSAMLTDELVWLTFDYKCEDDYDRTLAYAHIGLGADEFINRNMLRNGYAQTYFWYDDLTSTFDDVFADDEDAAQSENLGLWGACY